MMGGTIGWGTGRFMIVIGPSVQFAIEHLSLPLHPSEVVRAQAQDRSAT